MRPACRGVEDLSLSPEQKENGNGGTRVFRTNEEAVYLWIVTCIVALGVGIFTLAILPYDAYHMYVFQILAAWVGYALSLFGVLQGAIYFLTRWHPSLVAQDRDWSEFQHWKYQQLDAERKAHEKGAEPPAQKPAESEKERKPTSGR